MKFTLKLPSNNDLQVDSKSDDTVKNLVEKAATEEQLEPEQLQLFYGSHKLDEGATIESCNIPEGSQITVIKLMKYTLNLPSGRDFPVYLGQSELIKNMRETAVSQTHIEPEQLQLIYEGKKLDDNSTIESCNAPEGSKITVMTVVNA